MKVLVSGASGLVGSALVPGLRASGHEVRALVRSADRVFPGSILWNPQTGEVDQGALERWNGPDAVVHLAGKNIASGRWTEQRKRAIRDSRVDATRKLCAAMAGWKHRPAVFIGASAIGYYGHRGDEWLTEQSAPGSGFLAGVAVDWENAATAASESGIRVVHLRFGMILSGAGGALRSMLPWFKLGLGGPVGSGNQWVSWIARADVVRIILFALERADLRGPFNAVAPQPARNREFARALGGALERPASIRAPAFLLRLVFGEMADALLLASQRVIPQRLQKSGFEFEFGALAAALTQALRERPA